MTGKSGSIIEHNIFHRIEGYFSYQPGKRAGHAVATAQGTYDERQKESPVSSFELASLKPRVLPRQMEYRFKARDFSIDTYLNLVQTREYRVTITPQILPPLRMGTPIMW